MTGARFIIFTIITLLVQIFIAEFINLHQMVYIVITPLPVLFLPYNYSKSLTMVFAFIIGLLTDLSYDGVMGLNAAALVAHRAVTYLPVIHVFKIVAEQILHVVKRISAFN